MMLDNQDKQIALRMASMFLNCKEQVNLLPLDSSSQEGKAEEFIVQQGNSNLKDMKFKEL